MVIKHEFRQFHKRLWFTSLGGELHAKKQATRST